MRREATPWAVFIPFALMFVLVLMAKDEGRQGCHWS